MGSIATAISLDEYLNTTYEPDVEFVDGLLVERNVGTQRHSLLQGLIVAYLQQYRKTNRIRVFPEARLQVGARCHRIPDVLLLELPYNHGQIVTDVPSITVEIKSPGDRFDDIIDKCLEYEALGVRNILVMDPDNRRAFLFEHNNLRLLTGDSVQLNLSQSTLDFPFAEMFAELDEQ
jgi:Uma2 family endonuclease